MYILGVNAAFHDSAAALLYNGQLVAAAEEERFTGIKHGKRPVPFSTYELPYHAIYFCLEKAGIHLRDVDHIAYSFDPAILESNDKSQDDIGMFLEEKNPGEGALGIGTQATVENRKEVDLDQMFQQSIRHAPSQLVSGWPLYLQDRFLGSKIHDWDWHFVEHHLAHAASAFYPSPFTKAAVITLDGRGEKCTATYNVGNEHQIIRFHEVHFPDSLGLLYERVTTHLGFLHSSDEYKVMALASYGEPVYEDIFKDMLYITNPGSFKTSWNDLEGLFGPARLKDEPLTLFHFNIARSLQKVLEDTVVALCRWAKKETGEKNLCLAGGIALNCVLNGKIQALAGFDNVWIQPAAGDAGTSLGAALAIQAAYQPENSRSFQMSHAFWGPEYSEQQIEAVLKDAKVAYKKLDNVAEQVADLLVEDKMIGWFQGAMEFGPRALGHRSILASPLHERMQARLNLLKDREDFRPVAPVVLEEDAKDWFEQVHPSPFMLFVYKVKKADKNRIPAVTHVDGTARIQTINKEQDGAYYDLLTAFKKKTGVPILINTSFNTLGQPIVCSPTDALRCFFSSPLDALVMGPFLVVK